MTLSTSVRNDSRCLSTGIVHFSFYSVIKVHCKKNPDDDLPLQGLYRSDKRLKGLSQLSKSLSL